MTLKITNGIITRARFSGDCDDHEMTRLTANGIILSGSVGSTSCAAPPPPSPPPSPSWSPTALASDANGTLTYDDFVDVGIHVSYVVYFDNKLQAFSNGGNNYLYESTDGGDTWSYNSTAGNGISCWYATPPLVESNRILWSNGAGNGSKLYQWTGTGAASEISLTGVNLTSSDWLRAIRKIGSYYYISVTKGSDDKVYRTTNVNSVWTEIYSTSHTGLGVSDIVEYNGAIMIIHSNSNTSKRTINDFDSDTSLNNAIGINVTQDGSGNWLALGKAALAAAVSDDKGRYSEDNGVTWTETTGDFLRSDYSGSVADGDVSQQPGSLMYIGTKFVYIAAGDLVSTTDPFVASPSITLEKDFDDEINNLSLVGSTLFVGGREGSNYGLHKIDVT